MLILDVYRDYLQEKLGANTAVSKDVPAVRARQQVSLTQVPVSAHRKPRVYQAARIIVQCWHTDDTTTAELAQDLRDYVLDSLTEIPGVHRISLIGEPGRFDDPDDTSPRYQLTFDVLVRHAVPQRLPAAT